MAGTTRFMVGLRRRLDPPPATPTALGTLVRRWRRVRFFVLALAGNFLALALGTALVEDWSLLNGVYYAVTSLTTVGFGDLAPVTRVGRILFIFLVPMGIAQVFGIGFLILQDAFRALVSRRSLSMVSRGLSNHFVVCGYGKIGRVVVQTLISQKKPICVVEKNPDAVAKLQELAVDFVIGDVMDAAVLRQAGIEDAAAVITTFENDADNVYVVLEVREIRKDIRVVAAATSTGAARRLKLAGASRAVLAQALAGDMLAKAALNPQMIDLLTDVSDLSDSAAAFCQIPVQAGSWIDGHTLAEIAQKVAGALVVMVKDGDQVTLAPRGQVVIRAGMSLVVVGEAEAVKLLGAVEPP